MRRRAEPWSLWVVCVLASQCYGQVAGDRSSGANSPARLAAVDAARSKEAALAHWEPYCGIYALHRAMRSMDNEVSLAQLVKPAYVGSRRGSSLEELARAAKDFGLDTYAISRLPCSVLPQLGCPAILHVKARLGSKVYSHWILFLGAEGNKARIANGTEPLQLVSFDELAARWDGNALAVSITPIPRVWIRAAQVSYFLFWVGLCLAGVVALLAIERRLLAAYVPVGMARSWWRCVAECACLLAAVGAAAGTCAAVTGHGFLTQQAAIDAIQDSLLSTFLPKVSARRLVELIQSDDVTVIDARLRRDYDVAHIGRAVHIPAGSDTEQCAAIMAAVPRDRRLVVYCYRRGCHYSEAVARTLQAIGFSDITLFEGGWDEWAEWHNNAGLQ